MAKVSFASLKLKRNDEVTVLHIGEKEIEIKHYLPIEDKYDLVMISLQQAKENGIYNELKLDMFFHLNLVFMYTNLSFTEKQKEDLTNLYDVLESNDIIVNVINNMPEDEYAYLNKMINDIKHDLIKYENSIAGLANNIITNLPANAQAAADIVDNFNPEKYGEVINFARSIGMKV